MENPGKFDGNSSTTFKQWWESVTMYLGFYLETVDQQKIAWVGTLLTDTTLVLHLHRYWELQDVTNLARQAPKRRGRGRRHPCSPMARPHHSCRGHGHPSRLARLG